MDKSELLKSFDFSNKVAVVTGGAGVLLSPAVYALTELGARVALLGIDRAQSETLMATFPEGSQSWYLPCDVTHRDQVEAAADLVLAQTGQVDILVNGAGGNQPQATTAPERSFFDLDETAVRRVFDLNFMGAFLPCQVFGRIMARQKSGVILNIASMASIRPLTRIPAYAAAKSAVVNLTQWLAVHMAQEYSPEIRVNAIAPGFFLTQQNRYLLVDQENDGWTARGQSILQHTPMGRFGTPDDVTGAILWLLSPLSAFISGVIIPVDGGFAAFGGV